MRESGTFFLYLLIFSSTFVSGQAKQKSNLKTGIDQYSAHSVRALNKDSGERYLVYEQKIFYSDVDNDRDLDAVVELSFCESGHCNPTTRSSHMAVFLKSKGYRFAAGKTFIRFNEDNSIELMGKIKSIKKGKIYVAIYGCEVDDTVCLPKFLFRAIYSFKRNRLVKLRTYARASSFITGSDTYNAATNNPFNPTPR